MGRPRCRDATIVKTNALLYNREHLFCVVIQFPDGKGVTTMRYHLAFGSISAVLAGVLYLVVL